MATGILVYFLLWHCKGSQQLTILRAVYDYSASTPISGNQTPLSWNDPLLPDRRFLRELRRRRARRGARARPRADQKIFRQGTGASTRGSAGALDRGASGKADQSRLQDRDL